MNHEQVSKGRRASSPSDALPEAENRQADLERSVRESADARETFRRLVDEAKRQIAPLPAWSSRRKGPRPRPS